jgi:hypothetical protein
MCPTGQPVCSAIIRRPVSSASRPLEVSLDATLTCCRSRTKPASRASASSARLRSVMSRRMPVKNRPSAPTQCDSESSTGNSVPSARSACTSTAPEPMTRGSPVSRNRPMPRSCASRYRSGISIVSGLPTTSSAL